METVRESFAWGLHVRTDLTKYHTLQAMVTVAMVYAYIYRCVVAAVVEVMVAVEHGGGIEKDDGGGDGCNKTVYG